MLHAVLAASCEREFNVQVSDILDVERAVLQATTEATCRLVDSGSHESAAKILIFGISLFSRARAWNHFV
jgi:hypothetical protein